MNNMELFEAIGEIDGDLITRCENEAAHSQKRAWVKWLPVAACFCIVILCATILPIFKQPANLPGNDSNPPTTSANTGNLAPGNNSLLSINRLEKVPTFQNAAINLNVNDFVFMTDDEFLNYYGVLFSVNKSVPALKLQPQDSGYINGIFKNSSRGIYYDSHTFVFANGANTQRMEITLSKTAYYPGLMMGADERNAQLKQSEISGFAVTVFQYAGENGNVCFYTEFLNKGIAYRITSYNLPQKDFTAALSSVIDDNADTEANPSGAEDIHTVTGKVNAVDENANLISISAGDGAFSALKIYLPDGDAKSYSLGDKVNVIYVGNPITICTIWEQQLKSITAVND